MKRLLGIFTVVCALMGLATAAQAELTVNYTRSFGGLDPDGYFIAGTTSIDVTINVTSSIGGANTDPNAAVNTITALGFHENAPTGWSYGGLIAGANNPDIKPAANKTGALDFAWISPPTIPFTYGYKLNVPVSETGDGNSKLTGTVEYRTDGASVFTPTADKTFQLKPTTVSLARAISGAGVTGPSNQFYVPGQTIKVTITLTQDGPATVTALGVEDAIPAGWTFGGLDTSDPDKPDIKPGANATGTLGFGWITPPTMPFDFSYNVNVPANEQANDRTLSAVAKYRLGGGEIQSNTDVVSLDGAPCTTLSMNGQGGDFYVAGQTKTIVVTLDANCATGITALGVYQTLPSTWTYASLDNTDPDKPDIKPAANATGTISFAWLTPPTTPFDFKYNVSVPANVLGDQIITGYIEYRLGGGALQSAPFALTLSGADLTPPVITLNGNATVNVECHDTYTDAGATASDDRDGDITANIQTTGSVDTTTPGTYTLHYNVSDLAGNAATEVTRDVIVADTTAPVVTLSGSANVTVECGGAYNELGATVSDACDTTLAAATPSGTVDTTNPGTYTISYDAQDAAGNNATTVTRTVTVADTTAPTITLLGNASITVECHSSFTDPGATASDTCDGNITNSILATGSVDVNTPGTYTLTYNVSDSTGNAATAKTRTVTVSDTTKPQITLTGAATVTVECGTSFSDPGASASDACDGAVAVTNNGGTAVLEGTPGNYTVTYTASDAAGNTQTATRLVQVRDTTKPVLTLNGAGTATVECGSSYTDANGTATDTCDSNVQVTNNAASTVDASNPGTYTVTVTAIDDSGNTSTATRTVTVSDTIKPVISLTGSATVAVECGGSYTDAGATASDGCDGTLTPTVTGLPVDTTAPGTYTVAYNVSDSSGNAATAVTRTVTVSDTTNPVVTLNGAGVVTVECGGTFTDPGATATDTCEGSLTGSIVVGGDSVSNPAASGTYVITYTVADAAGNTGTASRTVSVADTTKPVIAVNGSTATVECGSTYTDAGATATDTCDGTVSVTTDSSAVLTSTPGTYSVTYTATDAAGNVTTASRSVLVQDTTIPVVTVVGGTTSSIACGSTYTELGATATDACDANIVVSTTGSVNTGQTGTYVITYTATDTAGNTASATRTVTVGDCIVPCDDTDGNGIPDGLFACLVADADNATLDVNGGTCTRRVSSTVWFANVDGADPVTVTLVNPNDPSQTITASVPRSIISGAQRAVITVSISCTLEDLLGDQAFNLGTTPDGVVAGNNWFDVSIAISDDDGATYNPIDPSVIAANPVTVSLNGLNATTGAEVALQSYPTELLDDNGAPLISAIQNQSWGSNGVTCTYADGTVSCTSTALGVFGAFETLPEPGALQVTPDPAFDLIVGTAQAKKETITTQVTLKNTGGSSITGTIAKSGSADFSIAAADANFTLAAGASKTITVSFAPTTIGAKTGSLLITPSVGAPVTVNLKGTGTLFVKRFTFLGCGAEGPASGSFGGDLAVISLVLGGLLLGSRGLRRAKQS